MTSMRSSRSLEQWAEEFVRRLQEQAEADRADNTAAYNRLHKKVVEALNAILDAGPRGRDILEYFLNHETPQVRMWAAGQVIKWDADKAVPVLGHLLVDKLPQETAAMERVNIRMGASAYLEQHFGITNFDRNELIEPLKAYGIDVPLRPERPWF
ncbi:hypothetical protein [Phyllobacterium phragmitis]|uniref:HEAT repeat domain-containing protein n=1 Tax=Phyllobacterium phragmitis TaxID=2670329 RepID=A0ABQ0GXP4_9HYPH